MLAYISRRLLLAVPTLFLVSVIVFGLMRLIPGDPAAVLLGEQADPASIAALHGCGSERIHWSRSRRVAEIEPSA